MISNLLLKGNKCYKFVVLVVEFRSPRLIVTHLSNAFIVLDLGKVLNIA